MMGRVLFTATLVRGHIAKFHIPYLRWFKEQGWETWVAAKNDYGDGVCEIPGCDKFVDISFARSPFSKQTFIAYKQLKKLLDEEHFEIIHTHTPVGSVLTRFAARKARRAGTKVVYTAHGFHFYTGAPVINWILWFPVEAVMSFFTDVLVTINSEDYKRAEKFAHCQVEYIPGVGIDLDQFAAVKIAGSKREELELGNDDYVLLSVGDQIAGMNQISIIRSLSVLPDNVKLLICGEGPNREKLIQTAIDLGVSERIRFLGFRDDITEIMALSDVLLAPSIHEGLPVSVLEAMACGVPVIAGSIRGLDSDLFTDGESGIILGNTDPESIAVAVRRLEANPEFANMLAENACRRVLDLGLEEVLSQTSTVYRLGGCRMLTLLKLGVSNDEFVLLSIGDLNDNKNHGLLIDMLSLLPEKTRLFVAGDGPLRDQIIKRAKQLGVEQRVSLLGFRKDIAALLNACDVFCFPSKREGLPVSLMQAAATATPCIASRARGCGDVLGDYASECIRETYEPKDWADGIRRLIEDKEISCRIGSKLYTRSEVFDVRLILERYIEVYSALSNRIARIGCSTKAKPKSDDLAWEKNCVSDRHLSKAADYGRIIGNAAKS